MTVGPMNTLYTQSGPLSNFVPSIKMVNSPPTQRPYRNFIYSFAGARFWVLHKVRLNVRCLNSQRQPFLRRRFLKSTSDQCRKRDCKWYYCMVKEKVECG